MVIALSVTEYYLVARPDEIRALLRLGHCVAIERDGACAAALRHGYPNQPIARVWWNVFVTHPEVARIYDVVATAGRSVAALVDDNEAISVAPIDLIQPGYVPPIPEDLDVVTIQWLIELVPDTGFGEPRVFSRNDAPARIFESELIVESIAPGDIKRAEDGSFVRRLVDWLRQRGFGGKP